MPRRLLLPLVLLALAGADAAPNLASRVPYPPLVEKLRASGGDPARILRPRAVRDLAPLESGRRYKFVVTPDGRLAIAPLPADAANNEYVHPILAGGGPVLTAGGLVVERSDGAIRRVTIDQDSKAYCPTLASLAAAERALVRLGVAAAALTRHDQPPPCAA
jgi:hypothetical protein